MTTFAMVKYTLILTLIINSMAMAQPLAGSWRVLLETPGGALPFNLELYQAGQKWMADIINGEEHLSTSDVVWDGEQLLIQPAVFHSELRLQPTEDDQKMTGYWQDYSRGDSYRLNCTAYYDQHFRFSENPDPIQVNLEGKWAVQFTTPDGVHTAATGVFVQDGNDIQATFLTATGDYRFLAGEVSGNQLFLSAFDGSHAFLFTATWQEDRLLGQFYSGNHWQESWEGVRDNSAGVPAGRVDLMEDQQIDFCFPDEKGNTLCLSDARFTNKVVVVQVMGTWCPNCMDETAYLSQLYTTYRDEGLEVIALAFERETTPDMWQHNLQRLRNKLGVTYTVLLAGNSSKKSAAAALPFLNQVIAYPTTLVIDRSGQIRYLESGFNGPATGSLFIEFKEDFELLITSLL